MRVDFGLILCIILQYLIFIYYVDTIFQKKQKNRVYYTLAIVGYIIHGIICMFGNAVVNIVVFSLVNFLIINIGCLVTWKKAMFHGIILTVLSSLSEIAVVAIGIVKVDINNISVIPEMSSVVLTVLTNLFYIIGVMILTAFFETREKREETYNIWLITIPVLSIIVMLITLKSSEFSTETTVVCLLLLLIDLIAFILNRNLAIQYSENETLKQQEKRNFAEFTMLKEKYDDMRIFRHDFKIHMNAVKLLIESENAKAKDYINSICEKEDNAELSEYSDNRMLNILLSQKKEECIKRGINLIIDPLQMPLSFISDIDIVAIFSNLFANAMENCIQSEQPFIYFHSYMNNKRFTVIEIENSSETVPEVIEGKLKTQKENKEMHGIGIKSIQKTLSKYNGLLDWHYDEERKVFRASVIIGFPYK